jgi:hypothetical protein
MPKAKTDPTPNLHLQHQRCLDEFDLNLADIRQMVLVGLGAAQDLRRCEDDPGYYQLPERESEMVLFSLHDLLRRVEELRRELSAAAEAAAEIGEPVKPVKAARKGGGK